MSEKYNRFSHVVENRVNNALKTIRSIGRLTNKSRYEYEEKDVKKIYSVLKHEIEVMREALQGTQVKVDDFKLR
jgi:hypothetical protein